MFRFDPNTVFVRSTFAERFDVCHVFAFVVNAFFVQSASCALALQLVWDFTPDDLLLVLFLVRAGFVYVGHFAVPFLSLGR